MIYPSAFQIQLTILLKFEHIFSRSQDVSLIWRFSGEILKIDEEAGVKIFTSTILPSLKPRAVLDHLRHFPRSLQTYLEFLIREKKDDEEAFHTQLALIYIDDISQGDKNRTSPSHRMTVNKLRSLLRTSPKLDLIKLSDTLDSPVFPYEHAIVCGRLGNHAAAINTFINNLKVILICFVFLVLLHFTHDQLFLNSGFRGCRRILRLCG